jgi:hypothetical protein
MPVYIRRYAPGAPAFGGVPSMGEQDIPDPFYDDSDGLSEAARLHGVIARMQAACAGLAQHLADLQRRCPAHPRVYARTVSGH